MVKKKLLTKYSFYFFAHNYLTYNFLYLLKTSSVNKMYNVKTKKLLLMHAILVSVLFLVCCFLLIIENQLIKINPNFIIKISLSYTPTKMCSYTSSKIKTKILKTLYNFDISILRQKSMICWLQVGIRQVQNPDNHI